MRSRAAIATAFAVAAGVVAVPVLNSGPGPLIDCSAVMPSTTMWPRMDPHDFTSPGPTVIIQSPAGSTLRPLAEPEGAAVARLSAVLRVSLAESLSGLRHGDAIHPTCPEIRFEPDVFPAKYVAYVWATDAAGTGTIIVHLAPATDGSMAAFLGDYPQRETRPDGVVVGWKAFADYAQVRVIRPDGTVVTLYAQTAFSNDGAPLRTTPVVPLERLKAIATDPALTLYP